MSIYGALKKRLSRLSHRQKEAIAKCLGGRGGWLLSALRAQAKHDEIYDEKYYEHVERAMVQSARVIAASLVDEFKPRTLIDVGCGSGALLKQFECVGVKVEGLEYSEAALRICRKKGLLVSKFNLESGARMSPKKYDLCMSTEVAEHIPENLSAAYVKTLCSHSDLCVITAATPGQGGTDHVNEKPHEYWIALFAQNGYEYMKQRSESLREKWKSGGAEFWYYKNAMVFVRVARQA